MRTTIDDVLTVTAQDWGLSASSFAFRKTENTDGIVFHTETKARDFILETRTDDAGNKILYFPFMSISDVHLGTRHSRAKKLSHMLEHTQTDNLKAVGDIIDIEDMLHKSHWNFAPWHRQVVAHILRKNAQFIPGNHDGVLRGRIIDHNGVKMMHRKWVGKKVYGVSIVNEAIYRDPAGRRIKIKHGDDFDDIVFGSRKGMWYRIGDILHAPLAHLDTFVQQRPALDSFSIAATVKKLTKTIINNGLGVQREIISSVDGDHTIDGLLYGHSHMGGIKKTPHGKLLLNDGCSTEHVQAMVHDRNGTYALITWHKDRIDIEEENGKCRVLTWDQLGMPSLHSKPVMIEDVHTQQADRVIRIIHRLAIPKDEQRFRKQKQHAIKKGRLIPVEPSRPFLPLHCHRMEQAQRRRATSKSVLAIG